MQTTLKLRPNEIAKVDLGIKFGVPKGYKLGVTRAKNVPAYISGPLELLNNMYEDYFQVAIQNISDREIELAQGTTLLQVEVRKCHASDLKVEWNELESCLEKTSKKWKESDRENRDDYVFAEYYEVETEDKLELVRKGLSLISPNSISIGPLKINLTESVRENSDEWYWLRVHERRFVKWFGSSANMKVCYPPLEKISRNRNFLAMEFCALQQIYLVTGSWSRMSS